MYGNKTMELRENQKADVVFWYIIVSLLLASVQCVLKVPDHTTRRSERTGSLHECIDSPHERIDSLWVNHSKTRQLSTLHTYIAVGKTSVRERARGVQQHMRHVYILLSATCRLPCGISHHKRVVIVTCL